MSARIAMRPSERDPHWRKRPRFWIPERVFRLDEMIRQGRSDESIARALGTTPNAINLARKRRGLPSRSKAILSAQGVAEMLGIKCSKTIGRWIAAGWLPAKRGQRIGPNRMWYVTEAAVHGFVADRRFWHAWDAARIPDGELRAYAESVRAGESWLTPGEVADRYFVGHKTVNQWIRRGVISAVKYGNWLIRERDLDGFLPPGQRSKVGRRVTWSAMDDARLLALRGAGHLYREIGVALGRSEKAVRAHAGLLRRREMGQ